MHAFSSTKPALAAIRAFNEASSWLHEAIASSGVEVIGSQAMHDESMGIIRPIGSAIFPCLSAIIATDQSASFDGREDTPGNERIGSNPTYVMGVWSWRKAPGRGGRELTQGGRLLPS